MSPLTPEEREHLLMKFGPTREEFVTLRRERDALAAENRRLREALEHAMQYGTELGTADPEWVTEARAALAAPREGEK